MGRIKSAWELALERTEDIQADPKKIHDDQLVKQGRQLAGTYLSDRDKSLEDIQEQLSSYPADERKQVLKGMALTVLYNLTLPIDEGYKDTLARVQTLAHAIDEKADPIMQQVGGFFDQYLQTQDHLIDRMKQQFQPMLEQKQEQLRQKYGPDFILRPEQDPEFVKLMQQNLQQLHAQYQQVLDQAKEQIKGTFGMETTTADAT